MRFGFQIKLIARLLVRGAVIFSNLPHHDSQNDHKRHNSKTQPTASGCYLMWLLHPSQLVVGWQKQIMQVRLGGLGSRTLLVALRPLTIVIGPDLG